MKNLFLAALLLCSAPLAAHAGEPSLALILSPYGGAENVTSSFSFSQLGATAGSTVSFELIGNYTEWQPSETFTAILGSKSNLVFAAGTPLYTTDSLKLSSALTNVFFDSNSGVAAQCAPGCSEGALEVWKLNNGNGYALAYEDDDLPPYQYVDFNDMVVKVSVTPVPAVPEAATWAWLMFGLAAIGAGTWQRRRQTNLQGTQQRLALA